MLSLVDGPCRGTYLVKRAPEYLRAVIGPKGEIDVLDQRDDKPGEGEKIHVYHRPGPAGWVHLKMAKRSQSGFYAMASYFHMPEVDGEQFREHEPWMKWVMSLYNGVPGVQCPVDAQECDKEIKTCCSCPRNPGLRFG